MWSKKSSLLLSKGLIIFGFIMVATILPFMPDFARYYDTLSGEAPIWVSLTAVFYITIGIVVILLIALFKLLNNISKQITFVEQNTNLLRCISWCCFLVAGIYLVYGLIVHPASYFSFVFCFIAGFMGLILRILKNVFAEAVSIREENDYTV